MQILEQNKKYFTARFPIEFITKVNNLFGGVDNSYAPQVTRNRNRKMEEVDPFEDELKIIKRAEKNTKKDFMSLSSFLVKAKKYAMESRD